VAVVAVVVAAARQRHVALLIARTQTPTSANASTESGALIIVENVNKMRQGLRHHLPQRVYLYVHAECKGASPGVPRMMNGTVQGRPGVGLLPPPRYRAWRVSRTKSGPRMKELTPKEALDNLNEVHREYTHHPARVSHATDQQAQA
jgi:hypothetical protein